MRIPRIAKFLIILVTLTVMLQSAVFAQTPYQSYYADPDDFAAAPGYIPVEVIDGNTLNTDKFKNPTDIFEKDGLLYLLDSGNSRVLVLDENYSLKETIKFTNTDGTPIVFSSEKDKGAQGIFIDKQNRMFISVNEKNADISSDPNGNPAGFVYVSDLKGQVTKTIVHPKSDLIPEGTTFQPLNTIVDDAGLIYICSEGTTRGTYQFDSNFNFLGFFGSQKVEVTPQIVIEMIWRKILSQEITDNSQIIIPTPMVNFDIDEEGYIFTVASGEIKTDQILKLNSLSNNVLKTKGSEYGDINTYFDPQIGFITSNLTDIAVDKDGFFYALDLTRGRVFVYDQEYYLISVFGAKNTSNEQRQVGTFHAPSSIEVAGDYAYVVDSVNNNVTVFRQTDYMKAMKMGLKLDKEGFYEDAEPYWREVLKCDSLNYLGNMGLGKYYNAIGEYEKSLDYSKKAFDLRSYSQTYKDFRDSKMNQFFPFIVLAVLILVLGPIIIGNIRAKHRKDEYTIHRTKRQFPFFCMFHPFKAYTELKYDKQGSLLYANIIIFALLIVQILMRTAVSYMWNPSTADILYFNLSAVCFTTLGGFVLWVVCNWAITTLFNGEGKFTEIWVFSAYAFLPQIVISIPIIVFSHLLTRDEFTFLQILSVFMYLWFAVSMIMAIKEVHQYTMKKTILAILLTLLGMILVICIVAIIYSMFVQLISFGSNIWNELLLRF